MVQRIGMADPAMPHPVPSGGQAPRLAKSSTALHFLIPPSAIGLQFGRFRPWRASIEVYWKANVRTNDSELVALQERVSSYQRADTPAWRESRFPRRISRVGIAFAPAWCDGPENPSRPVIRVTLRNRSERVVTRSERCPRRRYYRPRRAHPTSPPASPRRRVCAARALSARAHREEEPPRSQEPAGRP